MKRILFTLFIAVATLASWGNVSFDLQQPRNAVMGQYYRVVLTLSASTQNELAAAGSPSDFEIQGMQLMAPPGVSTGYSSSWINGVSSEAYTLTYTYVFNPTRAGDTTIPSVSLRVGNQVLKSRAASIKILPADSRGSGGQVYGGNSGRGQSAGGAGQQQGYSSRQPAAQTVLGSSVGKTTPGDLMVIITFSRRTVYEMEPVVADIKLCLSQDRMFGIGDQFNSVTLPEFDGFISEDLPVPRRSEVENINGKNYETLVLRRYLLYPQRSGQLRVSSGQYSIDVIEYERVTRGHMITHREVPRKMNTATNTVTLDVKPLPEPRPANFSGAVGRYSISADVTPEIVRSNESSTYQLVIKGSGNIKYLHAPTVAMPTTFETYTPKTDINANFDGSNYSGTFTADYPFVPQEVGHFPIEPFEFVYFDPAKSSYETVTARGFDLNVLRGTAPVVVGTQKEINTEMTDILHIHPTPEVIAAPAGLIFGRVWYWMAYVIVALALISVFVIYRRHIKREADVAGRRLARASRRAVKRFKVARGLMKRHESEQFYEEVSRALKGYLGDKLGIAPSALISDTISEKLSTRGVAQDVIDRVLEVLNDCEMARFTPSGTDEAMGNTLQRAEEAVRDIDNSK